MAKREVVYETLEKGPLVKKTESTGIQMSVIAIDGQERIDIREMYRTRDSDEWKPTSKGFTVPIELAAKAFRRFNTFAKLQALEGE